MTEERVTAIVGPPVAVDAAGAAELLGLSERLVRQLTTEGVLRSIAVGDKHRIRIYSVEALRRWALEASGYTPDKEGDSGTEGDPGPAETVPAEGREVAARRPGRPRKPRASSSPLPLRVVER